jgi:multiple antibiotic resistance protein
MLEHILYSSAALIALTAPMAELPIFIAIVEGRSVAEVRIAALKVALGALIILGAAAMGGAKALLLFGVSLSAFRTAAGFMLVVIGMQMLHGNVAPELSHPVKASSRDDQLWVPFLMPLTAGPAQIAVAVTLSYREEANLLGFPIGTLIAICAAALVILLILLIAVPIKRVMRPQVARITERFFGVFLVAIGFQMGMTGAQEFFLST